MADELLITNGTLVTWENGTGLLEDSAVYAQAGIIRAIGPTETLLGQYPAARHINAKGQLVLPGNINAHTHFYGAFARGMAIPGPAPKDFPEILERLWWPLDQALDPEAVRYSTLIMLIDAIKHGTTTMIDHHASPQALDGSLSIIADAVEEAGLRAVLCYEVTDRYGEQSAGAGIEENIRWIAEAKGKPHLSAMFGLHASLTLSEKTLSMCQEAMADLDAGFHIHVAEHEADEYDSLVRHNERVIERLNRHGILNEKSIVAHAVHIDFNETAILKETGTWVTHQPRSNMNNAVGAAAIESMLRGGIRVCLGTDGFTGDLWSEWKAAYFLHKVVHRDPRRANGMDIVKMAIHNNAALAGLHFPESPPGYLAIGAAADIILVDYHPYTPLHSGNLPWHILFGFEASMVTTTICRGTVLMEDRRVLTVDEGAIAAGARDSAAKVWERYQSIAHERGA